jgi:hypothetical protein
MYPQVKFDVLCLFPVVGVALSFGQNQNSGVATVVGFNGSARWVIGTNAWQQVKPGDELPSGSVVEAGSKPGDYVDLALVSSSGQSVQSLTEADSYEPTSHPDGVRLLEDSRLGISKLDFLQTGDGIVADIRLKLERGHLVSLVKKRSSASTFQVALPNGTAALRENTYDLSVDGIQAHGGPAVWRGEQGTPQNISVGHALDVHTGQLSALAPSDKPSVANAVLALASMEDTSPVYLSKDGDDRPVTPVHPPHPPHPPPPPGHRPGGPHGPGGPPPGHGNGNPGNGNPGNGNPGNPPGNGNGNPGNGGHGH